MTPRLIGENLPTAFLSHPITLTERLIRGLSNFHIAHHAVFQYTWSLPLSFPLSSVAGIFLNDWQTSGILTLSSGYPFTGNVSFDIANNGVREGHRPDLVAGADNNPVLGGPDTYFDVSSFELQPRGRLGRLGRNTLIGPGHATLDVAATRTVQLTEQHGLQFRAERFSIFSIE